MTKKRFYPTLLIALFAMIFVQGVAAGISVSPTTLSMRVGETATLTVTPAEEDTTKSQSPNRATNTAEAGTANVIGATMDIWPLSATLSPARITLREGEVASIEAAVLPANYNQGTPQWSVEDQSTASVTGNGLTATVKGLAVGTTTLHFVIANANASCVITVESADIWPKSVSLSPVRITLKVGEEASVEASVEPDNYNQGRPQWRMDNQGTASVAGNGHAATVKGLAPGTATLHFTVGSATASCFITVSKADEPKPEPKPEPEPELEPDDLGDIEIMPESIALNAGDRCQFRLQAEPEGVPLPTLQWSVTEGTSVVKILRAEGGSCWIDALKPGGATLTVTAGDLKAEASISVN